MQYIGKEAFDELLKRNLPALGGVEILEQLPRLIRRQAEAEGVEEGFELGIVHLA